MKQTALKSFMLKFGNQNKIIITGHLLKFTQLARTEQGYGTIVLDKPKQPRNNFFLLIIFLVLEDQEMIC